MGYTEQEGGPSVRGCLGFVWKNSALHLIPSRGHTVHGEEEGVFLTLSSKLIGIKKVPFVF